MLEAYITSICFMLAALNAFQLVYWSKQVQKLLDKLMSKDFNEYKLVNERKPDIPKQQRIQLPPDDIDNMASLNGFTF